MQTSIGQVDFNASTNESSSTERITRPPQSAWLRRGKNASDNRKATIIFGGLCDKDLQGMISTLSPLAARFLIVPDSKSTRRCPCRHRALRAETSFGHSMRIR